MFEKDESTSCCLLAGPSCYKIVDRHNSMMIMVIRMAFFGRDSCFLFGSIRDGYICFPSKFLVELRYLKSTDRRAVTSLCIAEPSCCQHCIGGA
jgi:hypothetical protein